MTGTPALCADSTMVAAVLRVVRHHHQHVHALGQQVLGLGVLQRVVAVGRLHQHLAPRAPRPRATNEVAVALPALLLEGVHGEADHDLLLARGRAWPRRALPLVLLATGERRQRACRRRGPRVHRAHHVRTSLRKRARDYDARASARQHARAGVRQLCAPGPAVMRFHSGLAAQRREVGIVADVLQLAVAEREPLGQLAQRVLLRGPGPRAGAPSARSRWCRRPRAAAAPARLASRGGPPRGRGSSRPASRAAPARRCRSASAAGGSSR